MNKKGKIVLTITGVVSIFILTALVVIFISSNSIRSQLPGKPDFKLLAKPVREQISSAHIKAYFNPTAANLGNLGMVYYSSAYQDKASVCYKLATKTEPA